MPPHLKIILSLLVAMVAGIMFYLEMERDAVDVAAVSLGLGALMIIAVWLFPETKRRD